MPRVLVSFFVLSAFLGFSACTKKDPVAAETPVTPPVEPAEILDKDLSHLPVTIDPRILDTSVSPCDDFYQYACGTWLAQTEIPAGYARWSRSFDLIEESNNAALKLVVDNYSEGKYEPPTPFAKKVGDYYSACMDQAAIEKTTAEFVPEQLEKIEALTSKAELVGALAGWHTRGVPMLFTLYSDQNQADARQTIGVADRSGLGLPDREYYLTPGEESTELRKKYSEHIARSLLLAKVVPDLATGQQAAKKILAFETELASKMLTIKERRDPRKIYNYVGLEGLKAFAPALPWDEYFKAMGHADLKELSVTEPEYFKALGGLFAEQSLGDLKTYLKWEMLRAYSPALGKAYEDENFSFYGKELMGLTAPKPRWKACLEDTQNALGEAVGEAFVKLQFNEESRTRAQAMIEHLKASVAENFAKVAWMDESTRAMAQTKLAKIVRKIGFPDKFRDYTSLEIDRTSYVWNSLRATSFERYRDLAKIGKPTDRTEWGMTPQTVNAYYSPNLNEIVFPAAILQPPFFHLTSPTASNFGGIMMIIGHEVTHAFDDSGRRFDELGNLRDWWSKPVAEAFEEKTACLVKQYDGYVVAEGTTHLDGKNTLGENIADLGGLKLSWNAFQKAKTTEGAGPVIAGLSDDKQFFVAFAQGWCTKATTAFEKVHAKTNVHAHPKYRVNGVVVNVPAFQQTFGCPVGAPMAPAKRCEVW